MERGTVLESCGDEILQRDIERVRQMLWGLDDVATVRGRLWVVNWAFAEEACG